VTTPENTDLGSPKPRTYAPAAIGPGRIRATWRSDLKRVLSPSFLLLSALSLAACSQSDGEPCQANSDCGDGRMCCLATQTARGYCGKTCPVQVKKDDAGSDDAGSDDTAKAKDGEASNTP
jgi:hypothetical protein